jgi:hypothetical protein
MRPTRSRTNFELTCFEADRNVVVRQLKAVGNAIDETGNEMEMIAVEKVFDPGLSKVLTDEARTLQRMARGLDNLRQEVARARFPETRRSSRRRQRRG